MAVGDEAMTERRSPAQRAAGLALRWAPLSHAEAEDDVFVIDIVNTGDARWRPDGDPFLVVGTFAAPGAAAGGTDFGFMGGQHAAVPLDPGEYARVSLSISESEWRELEPGRHDLHAGLVMLPVPAPAPLTVEITREQIDRHTARARGAVDATTSLRRQQRHLRSILQAASDLDRIARIVTGAESDRAVMTEVGRLLHDDREAASSVVGAPLAHFSQEAVQRTREQLRAIEHHLADPLHE